MSSQEEKPAPGEVRRATVRVLFRLMGHSALWLIVGSVVVPLIVLCFMLVVYAFDSRCGTPGDSGGCEMGMAVFVMLSAPLGAAIGGAYGLHRGMRALRRKPITAS